MLNALGGLGSSFGDLSSLVSMVSGFNPTAMYQTLGLDTSQASINEQLAQAGINSSEFDLDGYSAALDKVTQLQDYYSNRDNLANERREKDLADAKTAYFQENHYEFPEDKDGNPDYTKEPKIVEGAETAEDAAVREKYERRKLEEVEDKQLADSKTNKYPKDSARAKLQELQSNSAKMQELLQKEGGQEEYNKLVAAAETESENADIMKRNEQLKATNPPELHDMIDNISKEAMADRADSKKQLQAEPAYQEVQAYQQKIDAYTQDMKKRAQTGDMNALYGNVFGQMQGYDLNTGEGEITFS